MEVGDGLRLERQRPLLAAAGARDEAVADEVELELEDLATEFDQIQEGVDRQTGEIGDVDPDAQTA